MTKLIRNLREMVEKHIPRYYDGKLYHPWKHFMRGPGPACRAKRSSLSQQENGGGSRLAVTGNEQTRVSPDTLGALLQR